MTLALITIIIWFLCGTIGYFISKYLEKKYRHRTDSPLTIWISLVLGPIVLVIAFLVYHLEDKE